MSSFFSSLSRCTVVLFFYFKISSFVFLFFVFFQLCLSFSLANFDVCLPLYFSYPSLFLFRFSLPIPYRHHPLLPPLLPTTAEWQSTERPQFEHASLRITKDLSVRCFHPRRRFLFSFLRAPFGLSLFLSFSNFPSPVFLLSLFLFPCTCLSSSSSCASLFRVTFIPCGRTSSKLFSKWIRRDTDQTDEQYRCRDIVARCALYVIIQSYTAHRSGMAFRQIKESQPRTG